MKTTALVIQQLVRVVGTAQLLLGLLLWAGYALDFVSLHMLLGILLVLLLWTLAGMAFWARVTPGLAALAVAWGLVTPVLGMTQAQLLPGELHWIVRLIHLAIGLALLAQGEVLAGRLRKRPANAGGLQRAIG